MKSFQEKQEKKDNGKDSSIHDPNAIYSYLDNVNGIKTSNNVAEDFHTKRMQ
jgi:hypothetical protein